MKKFRLADCLWLLMAIGTGSQSPTAQSYRRHRLLTVRPRSEAQVDLLEKLMLTDSRLDFWTSPALNQPLHVNVSPQQFDSFARLLRANQIGFRSTLTDIQQLIDREAKDLESSRRRKRRSAELSTSAYNDWPSIEAFLVEMKRTADGQRRENQRDPEGQRPPSFNVSFMSITQEGRQVYVVNFNDTLMNSSSGDKPTILIDGGIHAREWISVAVVTHLLQNLIKEFSHDGPKSPFGALALSLHFHFYVANPDGYVYTWTTDRLWRKNRSGNGSCVGVDLNRNFPTDWGVGSSSTDPCSDLYRGPTPFSELETVGLRDWLERLPSGLSAYLSFHSYYQTWMYPWGGDPNRTSANQKELESVAYKAVDKVQLIHQRHYNVLPAATVPSPVGGSSSDWLKAAKSVPLVYTVELRPRCYSSDGFLLPQAQILPVAEEMMAGVQGVLEGILNLKILNAKPTDPGSSL